MTDIFLPVMPVASGKINFILNLQHAVVILRSVSCVRILPIGGDTSRMTMYFDIFQIFEENMAGVIYRRCFTAFLSRKAVNISIKPCSWHGYHLKRQHSSTNLVEEVTASRLKEVYTSKKHATLNGKF